MPATHMYKSGLSFEQYLESRVALNKELILTERILSGRMV